MANRPHGKIANLPREWRDVVNLMLRDGATYDQIIEKINSRTDEHGVTLNHQNLTNWFTGGHELWLKEQRELEKMKYNREFALQIVKDNEGSQIHEAGMQIAASRIYEALTDFDPEALRVLLNEDPAQFSKLANSMAKISDSGLKYERYRADVKKASQRMQEEIDRAKRKGGLTPETLERIEHELKLL